MSSINEKQREQIAAKLTSGLKGYAVTLQPGETQMFTDAARSLERRDCALLVEQYAKGVSAADIQLQQALSLVADAIRTRKLT